MSWKKGVALLLCSAVAACSATSGWIQATGSDPVILVHTGGETGAVGIESRLAYHAASKCVVLQAGDGINIPIWPPGTEPIVVDGRRGVDVKGVGRFLDGDRVQLGGNAADEEMIPSVADVRRCTGLPGRQKLIVVGQVGR
ncbi:hypothetical protein FH608_050805 [Nonomuraea phyllanthi]|uniref:Lipoprotein n=1 Tax=Nonomuraea phyllanthi TaxID=2219224 RepID=A0A5C4US50_9ACTN|nr:hypothetical protein [Nonomuraea phyllanthi]KAB8181537.1 hypothetical protein FH608_050805 [Nonomuraea phyllanthi]